MTSQINKMKREVSLPPIVVSLGLIVPHRSPFAEGYPELALPARSVQEPQHCSWSTVRRNCRMVHPWKHIREVVHNGVVVMDSRKAYVVLTFRSITFFDASWPFGLVAGSGKTILWYVSPQVHEFAASRCSCCQLARLSSKKSRRNATAD